MLRQMFFLGAFCQRDQIVIDEGLLNVFLCSFVICFTALEYFSYVNLVVWAFVYHEGGLDPLLLIIWYNCNILLEYYALYLWGLTGLAVTVHQ